MTFPTFRSASLVLAFGLLTGCSSTTLYKEHPEPGFQSSQIHKVLVISLSKRPETRVAVEDEFARQWKKRGVVAIASHVALPQGTPLEKSRVAPLAQAQGFDTALVSRLIGVQKIDAQTPGDSFDADGSTGSATMSQYFDAVVASPQYAQDYDYELAAATSNLYLVSNEKKIWSATTQILVQNDLPTHIKDYVNLILKTIYK